MSFLLALMRRLVYYFVLLSVGSVVLFKFVPIPITLTMIDRKLNEKDAAGNSDLHYSWRSIENMSKEAPLSVVAAEDQKFPEHWGFDLKAMSSAIEGNLKGGKLRGGSTISQQTAKNVFLWQSRSYVRKLLEFYFTGLIELIWGKQRILEVYLNVAETGKMTFGYEAAAQQYFKKPAAQLTRQQAARIAAILPNPRKWSATNGSGYIPRRANVIAREMRRLGGPAYLKNIRNF